MTEQTVGKWTMDKPTEPGWYWYCDSTHKTQPVEVSPRDKCVARDRFGIPIIVSSLDADGETISDWVSSMNGFWSRIEVPPEPAELSELKSSANKTESIS